MVWTKEEVKNFAEKDLRISKLAIVKSLIEKLSKEDVNEVCKVTDLVERYIDYVYKERKETTKRGQVASVGDDTEGTEWEQIAEGLNLAIPNSQNIKMLNLLLDEYKKAYKASANPSDILVHIINTFGEYPTKTKSVETVVKSLQQKI